MHNGKVNLLSLFYPRFSVILQEVNEHGPSTTDYRPSSLTMICNICLNAAQALNSFLILVWSTRASKRKKIQKKNTNKMEKLIKKKFKGINQSEFKYQWGANK